MSDKLETLKDIKSENSSTDAVEQTFIEQTELEIKAKLRQAAREWVQELKKNFKHRFGKKGLAEMNKILEARDVTYWSGLGGKAKYIQSDYVEAYTKISIINFLFNLEDD